VYGAQSAVLTYIIDAGHGGADGGAVSGNGTVESDVNLDIALRVDALLAFFGQKTLMTRSAPEIEYLPESTTLRKMKAEDQSRRLALINGTENAVLISIHQNKYPTPKPFGAQVFYAPTAGSESFGANLQAVLAQYAGEGNRRAAELIDKDILLMNHIRCTAVLIECGFLSNPSDEAKLVSSDYQKLLAVLISAGARNERGNILAARQ
jgi:N-acetylmuramoyl-L-alanine amidase